MIYTILQCARLLGEVSKVSGLNTEPPEVDPLDQCRSELSRDKKIIANSTNQKINFEEGVLIMLDLFADEFESKSLEVDIAARL